MISQTTARGTHWQAQPPSLKTLGRLELAGSRFHRPKPLLLLVYLVLEGAKPRRHIAELFWPTAADPMKSLAVALTRLRQGAPEVVAADNVRAWATVKTDAQEMLEALQQGKLEQAVAMYKGPFLEGFYLPDWSAELEEWVYTTREFLAGQVREALLGLAERSACDGQFAMSARHAEVAYVLPGTATPEPEDLPRFYTFMLAGGSSQVAHVRQEAQSYGLKLTLSADEARKQWQQKLEHKTSPVYSRLPSRATAFVGRDLELTEVATLLSEQDCQLLTLVGPAGVGKTRLGLQTAKEQAKVGLFKDGVYYVRLEASSTETLFPSILATLELDTKGSGEPLEKIIRHVGEKNVLLVLDNFEHLMASASVVAELVKACPNLKLLVTSRERLNLEGEQVFTVEGLPFPNEDVPLGAAQNFDAIKLFGQRARRARPDFTLGEDTLPYVLRLCRFVEGLPLALELAAAWVRVMSCEEMANELEQNLDLFSTTTRDVPERHQSIRLAFEHCSWTLLTATEQAVLRKLSVFRGGFRREAAAGVAGATIPVLASLVDKSLLRVTPEGRYDFHPCLYLFAEEKLSEQPDERLATEDKHRNYFFNLLQQIAERVRGGGQRNALEMMNKEWENIRVTLHWSVTKAQEEEALKCIELAEVCFEYRGRYHEGLEFFRLQEAHVRQLTPPRDAVLGRVLLAVAWYQQRLGHYPQATQAAEEGIKTVQSLGRFDWVARGLNTLGVVAERLGEFKRAVRHYQEALALLQGHPENALEAALFANLAIVEYDLGDYQPSKQHYLKALTLYRQQGDDLGYIRNLNNLGNLHLATGDLKEAEAVLEVGLRAARELDFLDIIPSFLTNLSEVACERRDFPRARAHCREALHLARTSGKQFVQVTILANLSRIGGAAGDPAEARAYAERALDVAWTIGSLPHVFQSLIALGEAMANQGDVQGGVGLVNVALRHAAAARPDRAYAELLLQSLQGQLSATELTQVEQRTKTTTLEEVVAELTQGLGLAHVP